MAKTGRKSKAEEIQIVQRYADLSGPAFDFIRQMFEKGDKNDKKWAVEQLSKGYQKMIPQQVTGEGGGPIQVSWASQVTSIVGPNIHHS